MPFASKAQRAFLFAKHPKLAKEFAKHTPKGAKLPKHVKKGKKKLAKAPAFVHSSGVPQGIGFKGRM
jgi:hypothetical protein